MEMNKEKNFVSAVIYVRNDEDGIRHTLNEIYKVLKNNFLKFEIICVNDCSNDNSMKIIKEFSNIVEGVVVSVVNMGFYHGLESSMNAGIDFAIGDFVFEFDSVYMDYESDLVMQIYRRSLEGYDIVSATPKNIKNYTSKLFYTIFNRYSSNKYNLRTEKFRVLSRRAINRVDSISKTNPYRKAIYATCGMKIDYISYDNRVDADMAENKQEGIGREKLAIDSLILFTDIAYKMSLVLSIIMILFTISTGVYTILVYFSQDKPVAGWAPIMGLISAGLFGVFLILTLIIKYLDLILKLIFKKQKYLISSIEKLR
ncbi:glycosyltransferase [Clostridium saccharoperbutylacetonicum]|uniref:glycosyltransferase n=1 Tax=Clostridium saccharoperbutylacetonicum TaxID=36745 RepID=UPI000983920C|nr:glycosyltransferase [Clostridium saccharoperbutylacetonicum]AQR97828.1 hypothetical protein CLSAP_51610 [Clostridium saccharoperbutylacetonicum]NSB33720.1 dolichol-phosphate mannosyltransferase [Clostridium saccharoperbutylacetonicum]